MVVINNQRAMIAMSSVLYSTENILHILFQQSCP